MPELGPKYKLRVAGEGTVIAPMRSTTFIAGAAVEYLRQGKTVLVCELPDWDTVVEYELVEAGADQPVGDKHITADGRILHATATHHAEPVEMVGWGYDLARRICSLCI